MAGPPAVSPLDGVGFGGADHEAGVVSGGRLLRPNRDRWTQIATLRRSMAAHRRGIALSQKQKEVTPNEATFVRTSPGDVARG